MIITIFKKILGFIKGDVPLVITYWVFGVLIMNIVTWGLLPIIYENQMAIIALPLGRILLLSISLITTILSILVLVAIWNSASKYKGYVVWKRLSKLVVGINMIVIIYNIYTSFDPINRITSHVASVNASLPIVIDENTRLDRVFMKKKAINFSYTILKDSVFKTDPLSFNMLLNIAVKNNTCDNPLLKEAMSLDYTVNYYYKSNNNESIANISMNSNMCDK